MASTPGTLRGTARSLRSSVYLTTALGSPVLN